jgi:hypothetical protein
MYPAASSLWYPTPPITRLVLRELVLGPVSSLYLPGETVQGGQGGGGQALLPMA